ncbi:MAG: ethanolamine utilization protein EutH [Candidatus Pseudomonas phytovorans]|uniref:Ethanolamine utilization protein EutH n=1 Tax=Candidatus Pseudomonas phytovorans TaxID=3121377 RepID=A0AAJ5WNC5_9PSED|nr:ethanolamine utilization protein EutH [Pseudomonas sp.]WEK32758.1 MAG: ethanolamine utilization protein EutH [Pseudomonas sp.]
MGQIGIYVTYVIMAFVFIGAIAAIRDSQSGMGKEFIEGIHCIGPTFIPVAGIMAAQPYLSHFVENSFGPIFASIGADPAIGATTIIAVDMGGYQLAQALAATHENWIMAMIVGYMAGATIIFSIPVGLSMLQPKDHKYMALGIMSGLLSIPIGVLMACLVLVLGEPMVRDTIGSNFEANYQLAMDLGTVLRNLFPLIIFCVVLALGLRMFPDRMIKGFLIFGKLMYAAITMVLALSIIQYFTGFFTYLFGHWGFDPIIADQKDQFRALEIAGYGALMLAGAFPMVYAIGKYLEKPIGAIGARLGLDPKGAAGMLAAAANILAMYRLVAIMRPKDKVLCIAFAVCGAWVIGDHLAFTANFQPTLIVAILCGKFCGGISGALLARWLSVPKAIQLGEQDQRNESESVERAFGAPAV